LRHRALAAGFAAAAAVVVVSGTAMAFGPTTWQKPPEPSGTPLPPPSVFAAQYDAGLAFGPSVTLSGPTPIATASPDAISTYFLVGQTPPIATASPDAISTYFLVGQTPPIATASPNAISTYFLVGQTPPIATPTPTPVPTAVPDTVANARSYARSHLDARQFACVDALWWSESRWNPRAVNATTGAYGIPQSLPATKMATAGRNWRTSPTTQVSWGLEYIAIRYGTACQAWNFRLTHGWY